MNTICSQQLVTSVQKTQPLKSALFDLRPCTHRYESELEWLSSDIQPDWRLVQDFSDVQSMLGYPPALQVSYRQALLLE